ncbi:carbohydrate ABC transporter permease [Paenibacillus sp. TRM 82003]|nr:carbohydrate ABC transporter permease [Paenibacillus sp. TRM 82003]
MQLRHESVARDKRSRAGARKLGGARRFLGGAALAAYAALTLYPLYWLLISAFKTNEDFFTRPYSLPAEWMRENVVRAWTLGNMGRAMWNSAVVSVCAVILTILLGLLVGYVLSRFEFRGKKAVAALFVSGLLIPIHSTLVPLFLMMNKIGLLDTYWALILPYTAFELPIAVFLSIAYLSSIPRDIEEAAMIDGYGRWGVFGRLIMPLCLPIVATIAIIAFLRFWNDFSFALVFMNSQAMKTLPLSLSLFSDGFGTDYALTMGAMAVAVIPTILAYLVLQEHIMKGMVAGSVKG